RTFKGWLVLVLLHETLLQCHTASLGSKTHSRSQQALDASCIAHFLPDDEDAPGSTCPVLTLCRMYETRCHVQSCTRHTSETSMVDSSRPRCRGAEGIFFASFMITASVALCRLLKLPEKGPSHVRRYPDDPRRYRLFGRLGLRHRLCDLPGARPPCSLVSPACGAGRGCAGPYGHPCLSAIRGDA